MRESARSIATYAAALALCVLTLVLVLKLWQADFNVPFMYWYDALLTNALVKGVLENGWYLHNAFLGAPNALDFYDFPMADSLHFLILKLLGLVCPTHAAVFNGYFLLTFPLTTLTALAVFRQFGVGRLSALAGSLLYAFLPYHIFRNESHLFLSAYYLVPPAVLVALWVYLEPREDKPQVGWGRTLVAVLICVLVSSAGAYYAIFTCFFLFVSGTAAALRRGRFAPLVAAALLIGVIGVGGVANLAPSLSYHHRHGNNLAAVDRSPDQAEIYGLRVNQLLLPISSHHVPALAQFKAKHNARSPLINENDTSSLGLIGGGGFIGLIVVLLARRSRGSASPVVEGLALFNAFALLVAGMGGLGALASFLFGPWLRGYCRMSVFIAFFSLFAVVLFLDWLARRFAQTGRAPVLFAVALALLTAAGLFDETPTPWDLTTLKTIYREDEAFVRRIEDALPAGAMVFQLPYVPFPEAHYTYMQGLSPFFQGLPTGQYDHLRSYLHSRSLRWSFGCMKGRDGDAWYSAAASRPTEEMVRRLALDGFCGVWVQRSLYVDHGAAIEAELTRVLGAPPRVDEHQRAAFFHLDDYATRTARASLPR